PTRRSSDLVLWFNVAHYAVRPWPWILAALAVIVLYPGLAQPESAYMRIVTEHVPHALRGVVFAGFMAAFMSTVATQLNWGASYLVADFYRRFVKRDGTEQHYVLISRLATVLLVVVSACVSAKLGSIVAGWEVVLTIGAGTGGVYLLRWYWWRINALCEILSEGNAPRCRVEAGCAPSAGRSANAGPGTQLAILGARLRHGVLGTFRFGEDAVRPNRIWPYAAGARGRLRRTALPVDAAREGVERGLKWWILPKRRATTRTMQFWPDSSAG